MRNGLLVGVAILLIATWTAAGLAAQTTTTSGTAQEIGPFTHYNFTTNGSEAGLPGSRTTTATSQRFGAFTTFDFQSSDGSSTSGSIWNLGTTSSWSLSTDEPATSSDPFASIWKDD